MADDKVSGTSSGTDWSGITFGTSTSGTDINVTVDSYKFRKDLESVYNTFKETENETNKGRKKKGCKACGKPYFVDEGIQGGFCTLDCKYSKCIIEEDKDGQSL